MNNMRTYLDILNEQNGKNLSEMDWDKVKKGVAKGARDFGVGLAGGAALLGGLYAHANDQQRHGHAVPAAEDDMYAVHGMHPGIHDDFPDESVDDSRPAVQEALEMIMELARNPQGSTQSTLREIAAIAAQSLGRV